MILFINNSWLLLKLYFNIWIVMLKMYVKNNFVGPKMFHLTIKNIVLIILCYIII
jgi:hypothetical protein